MGPGVGQLQGSCSTQGRRGSCEQGPGSRTELSQEGKLPAPLAVGKSSVRRAVSQPPLVRVRMGFLGPGTLPYQELVGLATCCGASFPFRAR